MSQVAMRIDSVRHAMRDDSWVILLKEMDGDRYLPICVGVNQAQALIRALKDEALSESLGDSFSVPHIVTMLPLVESALVVIGGSGEDAFFATLRLTYRVNRSYEIELPAAAALTLGIRAEAQILVEESVLDEAAVAVPV